MMELKLEYTQKHFVDSVMELRDEEIRKILQALVDTLIEHKNQKDQAPQWTTEIPGEGGYYWFRGEMDKSSVEIMALALHHDQFFAFGENKPIPSNWLNGDWLPIIVPEINRLTDAKT